MRMIHQGTDGLSRGGIERYSNLWAFLGGNGSSALESDDAEFDT
jgi:hypothetical protein